MGHPQWGGRKKGTPNRITAEVRQQLQELGCNPIEGMVLLARGEIPCRVCQGKKKMRYRRSEEGKLVFDPEGAEMDCLHCYGSGFEPVTADLSLRAYIELAQYVAPKRRAIEFEDRTERRGLTWPEYVALQKTMPAEPDPTSPPRKREPVQ